MKLYLFRHAQKAMDFSGDPDLAAEGHGQALKILDKVLRQEIPQPTELWVSPRKRTVSTFRPLSQHLNLPLKTEESLLEQHAGESLAEFRHRIAGTLEGLAKDPQAVIFICTHYDWVVEAMSVITTQEDLNTADFSHWTPAQHVGFEVASDGLYKLLELKRI